MRACVVMGILRGEDFVIYGTDLVPETGRTVGNAVSLMLQCATEAEVRERFERLGVGGRRINEVEQSFWGGVTATVVDGFGVRWILVS